MKYILVIMFMGSLFGIASETVKGAKKDFQSAKSELTVKLENLEAQIKDLTQKIKSTGNETQQKTLQDLTTTKDQLKIEINELQQDSKQSWKKFTKAMAESIDKLNDKVQSALKEK